MEAFHHFQPNTVEGAVALLREAGSKGCVIAGGTDLVGCLKDDLWLEPPEAVIDLKSISGLNEIHFADNTLKVGALATLTEISESELVRKICPGLAEAARRTATPLLRNMGSIGGNICQENRCWYYRYPDKLGGKIPCVRKGGQKCLAVPGDHRYHSIFGAVCKCIAVNPSDTAPALVALDAQIVTSQRTIPVDEFFSAEHGKQSTSLQSDEIVLEIVIPAHSLRLEGKSIQVKSVFKKLAFRKSIDFALVNCATCVGLEGDKVAHIRVCLNGVYNNPLRAVEAEEYLLGKELTEETVQEAARLALEKAKPMPATQYKVHLAQSILGDCLLGKVCCSHY